MNWSGVIRFAIRYGYFLVAGAENAYRIASHYLNFDKMKRLGLFTPEQENLLIEAVGKHVKLKNKLYTRMAKFGVKILIQGIDNFGLDKIKQEWKADLIPVLDSAIKGDKQMTRAYVTDLLNKKIDFKRLDDEQELMLFDSLTRTIALAIDIFTQKNNS